MHNKSESTFKEKWLRLFLWGSLLPAFVFIAQFYISSGITALEIKPSSDFYKFYLSASRLTQHESIYWPAPDKSIDLDCSADNAPQSPDEIVKCLHPNLNPPLFTLMAWPLANLTYEKAWGLWSLLSWMCGITSIWLMLTSGASRNRPPPLHFAWGNIALLYYYPVYCNFTYGQISLFLMPPLLLSWMAMREDHQTKAGIWLGMITSIKPFFALFIVTFVLSGKLRAASWLLTTTAVLTSLSIAFLGWQVHLDYLSILGEVNWTASNWNASFTGFFSRILGGSENMPWIQAPKLGSILSTVSSLTLVCLIAWCLKKRGRNHPTDSIYVLTIPALLLTNPLGWFYYFPLLILCIPFIWQQSAYLPERRVLRLLLLFASLLTAIPRRLKASDTMNDAMSWWWDGPLCFYVLLTFFMLTTTIILRLSHKKTGALSLDKTPG